MKLVSTWKERLSAYCLGVVMGIFIGVQIGAMIERSIWLAH